jgi:hypothetical protein
MKAFTLTKTINFSELKDAISSINSDKEIDINIMGDGYEVDYWINKLATELKSEEYIKLANNFICIGYDEVDTFTFIRKSYLISEIKSYLKGGASEDFIGKAIVFSAADSIIKRIDYSVGTQQKNIASQYEMTIYEDGKNTELTELVNDIDNCGTMELYFDDYSDFLDTIIGTKNRIITGENLDLFLDTIIEVYPKEVYYDKREQQQAKALENEIEIFLNNLTQFLTIDAFSNREKIIEFIVEDILECTTYDDYTSEDIKIAFRRLVEVLIDK